MAFNKVAEKRKGKTAYPDYETKPVGVSNKVDAGKRRAGDPTTDGRRPGAAGECPVSRKA